MSGSSVLQIDEKKDASYQRIKVLKEGGFGKAYLAEDLMVGDYCVIKEAKTQALKKSDIDDILKEADILKVLVHPNIIRFRDIYTNKKMRLCIVMDFADAGDLFTKIENAQGYFSETEILDMFTQLCLAIKHIHDRKIIHRDLKSQNIFLNKLGIIKLGDFGISEILNHTHDLLSSFVGTWYYLSPEIVKGHHYSFKTDIWSLGVILYEMCCLKLPFKAQNQFILQKKIQECKYSPIPSKYSSDLRRLIEEMLVVDPSQRPSISQILAKPIIRNRINNFLNEKDFQEEFSHTILHNHNVMKANLPPLPYLPQQPVVSPTNRFNHGRNYQSNQVLPPHLIKKEPVEGNLAYKILGGNDPAPVPKLPAPVIGKRAEQIQNLNPVAGMYKDRLDELRKAPSAMRLGDGGGGIANRYGSAMNLGAQNIQHPPNYFDPSPLANFRRNEFGLRNNLERPGGVKAASPEPVAANRNNLLQQNRGSAGGGNFFNRVNDLYGKLEEFKQKDLGNHFDLEEKFKELDYLHLNKDYVSHVKKEAILHKYKADFDELRKEYREAYDIKPTEYRPEDELFVELKFQDKHIDPIPERGENDESLSQSNKPLLAELDKEVSYGEFLSEVLGDIYGTSLPDSKKLLQKLNQEADAKSLIGIDKIFESETSRLDAGLLLLIACSEQ